MARKVKKPVSETPAPVPAPTPPPAATPAPAPAPVDPFDPRALRLDVSSANLNVKKLIVRVPVGKPPRGHFFRVHPSEEYRMQTYFLVHREDQGETTYLIAASLHAAMAAEPLAEARVLVTVVNRAGHVNLWPLKLISGEGGRRDNSWNLTAWAAAQHATQAWVRMDSDRQAGEYIVTEAKVKLPEPEWPPLTFHELVKIAFRDHLIDSLDHPVLRQLRGEA